MKLTTEKVREIEALIKEGWTDDTIRYKAQVALCTVKRVRKEMIKDLHRKGLPAIGAVVSMNTRAGASCWAILCLWTGSASTVNARKEKSSDHSIFTCTEIPNNWL